MAFASDTVWDDNALGSVRFPSIKTSWLVSSAAVLGLGVALAGWSLATVATVHKMETSLSSTPTLLPESTFAPGAVALFDPAHRIEHLGDKLRRTLARYPAVVSPAGTTVEGRVAAASGDKSGRIAHAAPSLHADAGAPLAARFGEGVSEIVPQAHRHGADFIRSRLAAAGSVKSARVAIAGAAALSARHQASAPGEAVELPNLVSVVPQAPSNSRFAHEVAEAVPTLLPKVPSAERFGQRGNDAEKPSRIALAVIDAELKDAVSSPPLPSAPPARNAPPVSDDAAGDSRRRDDDSFSGNFPDSVPLPTRRPALRKPAEAEVETPPPPAPPERTRTSRGVLAYASPDDGEDKSAVTGLGRLFERKPRLPGLGSGVAVYDIRNAVVYMPNGEKLEAHSGLGTMVDKPRYVDEKNRGPTPPNTYKLVLRERRFHGVEAIRLLPVDGNNKYGRNGLLAHTYMLRGGLAQSNGCVVFKDYQRFLHAFKNGRVNRLVVVPDMSHATPAVLASAARGA